RSRQQGIRHVRLRIGLLKIREREKINRIEDVRDRLAVPRGLRKAHVETPTARTGDVRPDSIEHFAILLIGVEAVVNKMAQQPPALRCPEADRTLDELALIG